MKLTDLATYTRPLAPTLSIYVSVDGRQPPDAVAAVAVGPVETPVWFDRNDLVEAVSFARGADAAGLAWFQREGEAALSVPLADPPRDDLVVLAPLPVLVPLVETMHRTLDHVVVASNLDARDDLDETATIYLAHVPPEQEGTATDVSLASTDPVEVAEAILGHLPTSVEMVLVALPDGLVQAVIDRLAEGLGPSVAVVALDPARDLADQSVRAVADRAATEMVEAIRMFRFLQSHDSVAQGLPAVAEALSAGRVRRLLVGLGLDPTARVLATASGHELRSSGEPDEQWVPVSAPDGLIRSALLQGVDVRIIPEHLADGPADGVGAMLDGA